MSFLCSSNSIVAFYMRKYSFFFEICTTIIHKKIYGKYLKKKKQIYKTYKIIKINNPHKSTEKLYSTYVDSVVNTLNFIYTHIIYHFARDILVLEYWNTRYFCTR